ncbi:MAG: hypothetical protein K8R17_11640 [Methanosarcinales archaeon]|nr:hypothetical protein [Methanosarcinales archaeon]
MSSQTLDLLSFALLIGGTGFFLLLIGVGLGKLLNSTEKISERGLNRPMDLNLEEQLILFFHNPDITIPLTFIVFGGLMLVTSLLLGILSAVSKFLT